MSPILTWLIANPPVAGAIAFVVIGLLLWLADSGKLGNVSGILAWFRRTQVVTDDQRFDSAFAALDVLGKVASDKGSTVLADLCADMADELTHTFYPRRTR